MSSELLLAVAGNAAGAGPGPNVEDLFSTYLYTGNSSAQVIENGIALTDENTGGSVEFGDGDSLLLTNAVSTSAGGATNDFTFECWFYKEKNDTNPYSMLFSNGSTVQITIENTPNGALTFYVGGSYVFQDAGTAVTAGAWHHIAFVRSGTTVTGYVDGVSQGSGTYNGSFSINRIATYNGTSGYDIHGYLLDVRWVIGTAVYTANFTPPTSPLTDIANTVLLTCQPDNPTTDASSQDQTITVIGNPKLSTFGRLTSDTAGRGGATFIKYRSGSFGNGYYIQDTERGQGNTLILPQTAAQVTSDDRITSLNGNGFSVTVNGGSAINNNGYDHVSWTFAKQEKFFDVVTYTGNGVGGANAQAISHNLGAKPGVVIIKRTDSTGDWWVFTDVIDGSNDYGYLNKTDAFGDSSNNVATSSVFNIGGVLNTNNAEYVAYLFANNDGDGIFGEDGDQDIIKCGTYTGNGSYQGPLVSLGWEPQWVLIKETNAVGNWFVFDTQRKLYYGGVDTTGGEDSYLLLNSGAGETATSDLIDINGDGFQPTFNGGDVNTNSNTYLYIAIRNGPMAVPTTATEVYHSELISGTASANVEIYSPFPPDLMIEGQTASNNNKFWASRHTGEYYYGGGHGADYWKFDGHAGQVYYPSDRSGSPILYFFRRSPQFCDVTAYQGIANNQTVPHNLGVAPEMMLIFNRFGTYTRNIWVGDAALDGLTPYGTTGVMQTSQNYFNNTAPSATHITIGNSTEINESGSDYDVFMFATLEGISKVGTFSHTAGTATNVDCGFSNGARFVMWRRYDGSDYLNLFDTERGIVSGTEPYFQMATTGGQITDDLIDPLSSGFSVSTDTVNATGNYFFLAIA